MRILTHPPSQEDPKKEEQQKPALAPTPSQPEVVSAPVAAPQPKPQEPIQPPAPEPIAQIDEPKPAQPPPVAVPEQVELVEPELDVVNQDLADTSIDEEEEEDETEEYSEETPRLEELLSRFSSALEQSLITMVASEPGQTHNSAVDILSSFTELESQREELDRIEQEIEEGGDSGEDDEDEEDDEENEEDEEEDYQGTLEEEEEEVEPEAPPQKQQVPPSTPVKSTSKVPSTSSTATPPARNGSTSAAANAALARLGGGNNAPKKSSPLAAQLKKAPAPPRTLAELGLAKPEGIRHASAAPKAKPTAARTGPGGRRIAKGGRKATPSSPAPDPTPVATPSSPPDTFGFSSPAPRPRMGGIYTLFGGSESSSPSRSNGSSTPGTSPVPIKRIFAGHGAGQTFDSIPMLEYDPQTELALKLKAAGRTPEAIERAMRAARSAEIRARGLSPAEAAIAEREARRLDADTLEKILAGHIMAPAPVLAPIKKKKRVKAKEEASMPAGTHLAMFARRLAKTPLSVRAQSVATAIAAARRWQAKGQEMDEMEALKQAAEKARAAREKEEMERRKERKLRGEDPDEVVQAVNEVLLLADYDELKALEDSIRASKGLPSSAEWEAVQTRQQEKERKVLAAAEAAAIAAATLPSTGASSSSKKKNKKKKSAAPQPPVVVPQASGRGASAISQRSLDALAAARSVDGPSTPTPSQPSHPPFGITVPASAEKPSSPPPPLTVSPPLTGRGGRAISHRSLDLLAGARSVQAASSSSSITSSSPSPAQASPFRLSSTAQTFSPSGQGYQASEGLTHEWGEYQAFKYLKEAFPNRSPDDILQAWTKCHYDLGRVVDMLTSEDSAQEEEDMKIHYPSIAEGADSKMASKRKEIRSAFYSTLQSATEMIKRGYEAVRLPGAGGRDRLLENKGNFEFSEVVARQTAATLKSAQKARKAENECRKRRREFLIHASRAYKGRGPSGNTFLMTEFTAQANSWGRKATIYSEAATVLEVRERRQKATRRQARRTLVPIKGRAAPNILDEDLLDEIDLHELTVREAEFITLKFLESWDFDNKPTLDIITGAGIHSVGGIAKIRPAIKKLLEDKSLELGIRFDHEGNQGRYTVRKNWR